MNKSIFMLFIFFSTLVLSTFNDKFQDNLRLINYSFVTPKIVARMEIRPRRWINAESEVHVSVGSWILRTRLNHHLKIPLNSTISWIVFSDSISSFNPIENHCEARYGDVLGSKQSLAIMTICKDHFYIWFQLGKQNFAVQPMNDSHILEEIKFLGESETSNGRFRRQSDSIDGKFYNLTGDTVDLIDQDGPTNVEEQPEYKEWENLFSSSMWIKSEFTHEAHKKSSTQPRWLELGIAVDYSVIDFHGERVQQYVFALLNIVSAIYKDASLGADLTLVISRIIFYVEKKDGMVQYGNARKSLENVNKWNRKILSSSSKAHDVAVWLTRLDIGGPSGYAPVSGACDPARSCALNRDEGLTSAFIIAHELAHILGLTHDGDEAANNSCGREALAGSVMAPMVAATFHRFHWSPCSRNEFHQRSKKWNCLNNSPDVNNNATEFKGIPYHAFTMDEQCRMEFGDGYELCRSFELPGLCSHLWCGHRSTHQVCKTKKGPPLEGTACGGDKWCINGSCEPIDRSIFQLGPLVNKPNNEWSEWSSWSKCSTTCGIGIRRRERQCNKFITKTENNCVGSSKNFEVCQQSPCHPMTDPRREQCARLASSIGMKKSSRRHRVVWWPHELDDEGVKCRLTCRNVENGRIHVGSDFVPDGTACSYDSTDICIEGKCHSMGCDRVLNSSSRRDACGVCAGDNSTCISFSNKFQRNIRRANIRIARAPSSAFDIAVEIEVIPPLRNPGTKFVIRDARRRKFDADIPESHLENRSILVVENTAFRMEKIHDVYKITGRGPTSSELIISLKIPQIEMKRGLTVFVNFRYMANRGEDNKTNTYSWVTGGWSPCSATCGGGFRHRTAACKNDQTGWIEHRKKCKLSMKPLQHIEKCNTFSCDFKWIPGPWEGCSKTCGAQGSQQRQIYCVHLSFSDNQLTSENEKILYRVMLPPNICKNHHLPQTQRGCNRVPCRGNWVFTDWSACTQTCGGGLQSRVARCMPPVGESLFECESANTTEELRPCRGHGRRHPGCELLCRRDRSRYCAAASLKKYCRIPGFRRECCQACKHND